MKTLKTHYITMRLIFDKPVEKKAAFKLAKSALLRQKIATPETKPELPTEFTVAMVIPK